MKQHMHKYHTQQVHKESMWKRVMGGGLGRVSAELREAPNFDSY